VAGDVGARTGALHVNEAGHDSAGLAAN
jgi:hypothetical protein